MCYSVLYYSIQGLLKRQAKRRPQSKFGIGKAWLQMMEHCLAPLVLLVAAAAAAAAAEQQVEMHEVAM